jgi:hypothetical protein
MIGPCEKVRSLVEVNDGWVGQVLTCAVVWAGGRRRGYW